MKRSIGVILACALVLTLGIGAWAAKPVPDAYTTTKVTGGGWFICENDVNAGNHCSVTFQAKGQQEGGAWSGSANFIDRDYTQGLLHIKMTVQNMAIVTAQWIKLTGTATATIGGVPVPGGPFTFILEVVDGAAGTTYPDRVGLTTPSYVSLGDLAGGQIKFH